jgi:hypothetical protein
MLGVLEARLLKLASVSLALAALGSTRLAHASGSYPVELSKALDRQFPGQSYCVPSCAACHLTNKGGPGELNVFGKNLQARGGLLGETPDNVDPAINQYFNAVPPDTAPQASTLFIDGTRRPFFDSDKDGISDYTELQNSDSPSLKLPRGEKEFCPDILYGCGARVAAAPPPVDRLGLFSAGLVVFGLAAFRRWKRMPRPR